MSTRVLTVFLSSTGRDLGPYRTAIRERMRRLDHFRCDAMETFGARDATALDFCRERVVAAEVFVGLIGHYRGWEPPGDNQQRSITEMEYDWATDAGKSRLMFVAPETMALGKDLDGEPGADDRQTLFRRWVLSAHVVEQEFGTPDQLAALVMAALANLHIGQLLKQMQRAPSVAAEAAAATAAATVAMPPKAETSSADQALTSVLAELANDPEFARFLGNPAAVDVTKLEAALAARAGQRRTAGAAQLKSASADYRKLGEVLRFHDVAGAAKAFWEAARLDPDNIATWTDAGDLAMSAGRLADAREAFEGAARAAQRQGDGHRQAQIECWLGDVEVRSGNLGQALLRYQSYKAEAERLAKSDPGNAGWQRDQSV